MMLWTAPILRHQNAIMKALSLVRNQPWSTTAVQRFPVDPSPSYNLVSLFMSRLPTLDLVAAFSIENLLNQDYEKYMCCSSETGYVVPSPGMTTKENTGTGDQAGLAEHLTPQRSNGFASMVERICTDSRRVMSEETRTA
jgi:hypothetical protein